MFPQPLPALLEFIFPPVGSLLLTNSKVLLLVTVKFFRLSFSLQGKLMVGSIVSFIWCLFGLGPEKLAGKPVCACIYVYLLVSSWRSADFFFSFYFRYFLVSYWSGRIYSHTVSVYFKVLIAGPFKFLGGSYFDQFFDENFWVGSVSFVCYPTKNTLVLYSHLIFQKLCKPHHMFDKSRFCLCLQMQC